MAARKTLRHEIEELRAELAELRVGRDEDPRNALPQDSNPPEPGEASRAEVNGPFGTGDIEQAIRELAEATESEIAEHPLMVVALAFLLGFVLGRLSRT